MLRQILTLLAIASAFFINVWSNLFPIGGLNIGEVSNTLFQDVQIIPASYAFAIWGLIYLGLFAFGIYQALPPQRQQLLFQRIDYWIVVACIAQIIWVFAFLLRLFALSVGVMLVILVALIGAYWQLKTTSHRPSRSQRWLVHFPISIYLGWISVATIVNVASALDQANWDGWGLLPIAWTVIMMLISGAIATFLLAYQQDIAYTLVVIWALVAIAIRQSTNSMILAVAMGVAIALALFALVAKFKPTQPRRLGDD